jgi:putative ABC transport system permease protein
VWSETDPLSQLPAVRRIRDQMSSDAVIVQPGLLSDVVRRSNARIAFAATLMAFAAGVGFVLGAVGIYAVVDYATSLRAREIALRIALGADREAVVWIMLRRTIAAVLVGLCVGLWAAAAVGWLMASQLFVVRWYDPTTYIGVGVGVLLIGFAASSIPAFRAASVSPRVLLR